MFITLKELFKPTVMFFSLMNLLAIFQIIIDEILQDLINTGEIVSFINNVIVKMEKKEHDKIVEEVVKRLAENNSYVKPEKCKWKVREVEFLEVVAGLKGIKIHCKKK